MLAAPWGVTEEEGEEPRARGQTRTKTDTEPQDNTFTAPENGCFLLLPLHIPSYSFKRTNTYVLAEFIH